MKPEKIEIVKADRNSQGEWINDKTLPLEEKDIPSILLAPASEHYPLLVKALGERNITIPPSWQVQHMLTAIFLSLTSIEFQRNGISFPTDTLSEVKLVVDDHYQKDKTPGEYNGVVFLLDFDGYRISSSLHLPGNIFGEHMNGVPWYLSILKDGKQLSKSQDRSLFTPGTSAPTETGKLLIDALIPMMTPQNNLSAPSPSSGVA